MSFFLSSLLALTAVAPFDLSASSCTTGNGGVITRRALSFRENFGPSTGILLHTNELDVQNGWEENTHTHTTRFSLSMEMSRLTRHGTVSRDQILRRERGQGNIFFHCSAGHEQDWQSYLVDLYSCHMCTSTKFKNRHVITNGSNPLIIYI